MELNPVSNHYELLDITPDASPQEIRAAYLRAKSTFQKDSLAIYSLMDPSDAQDMLQKIEHAYQILSHPEKKRAYDQNFSNGLSSEDNFSDPFGAPSAPPFRSAISAPVQAPAPVVSIDRVPPMESSHAEDLLVPPSTDYSMPTSAAATADSVRPQERQPLPSTQSAESSESAEANAAPQANSPPNDPVEALQLESVEDWTGPLLRNIRNLRDIPMERLVEITRIRRSYLAAIEQEEFEKLPAPVFVRGFLIQIARELKVPSTRLVSSYLGRLERWTVSQNAKSR